MATRIAIAALWLFTSLYAGSMLHALTGTSELVGPALGLVTAAAIILNPAGRRAPATASTLPQDPARLGLAGDMA